MDITSFMYWANPAITAVAIGLIIAAMFRKKLDWLRYGMVLSAGFVVVGIVGYEVTYLFFPSAERDITVTIWTTAAMNIILLCVGPFLWLFSPKKLPKQIFVANEF